MSGPIPKLLTGNIRLRPAQDHVRPATYAPEEGSDEPRIVIEERYIDGEPIQTVLLDSIPSQANRMEAGLYELREVLGLPDVVVEYNGEKFSQWELPHRIFDAVIRDSLLNGDEFFKTSLGQELAVGKPAALFKWAPNVLLFGGWNSHAQELVGHLKAARVERTVTSEIVGLEPKRVARTQSRLDPTGIPGSTRATPKYNIKKKFSELGLGNVAPGFRFLDVAIREARQLVTFTAIPWQRMGLPQKAQEVLFNLFLLALAQLYEKGIYLRSGTHLYPANEEQTLTDPTTEKTFLIKTQINDIVGKINSLLQELPEEYRWEKSPLTLTPSPALAEALSLRELASKNQK